MMLSSGRTHPQEHSVKVWAQSDQWFPRYSHYCILPLFFPDLTIWDWNMASALTSSASMPATSVLCQAPVNVPLPTYDWNVGDQMQEFSLFKCQLETWFWLCKIKAEECFGYLLCILGKEGYVAMDCWVLPDEGHKGNPEKFLDYIESTLDDEISPRVHVYELEDVKKRSDKSINELVDRIHQLACCAQIGNGSDAAIEFKVQHRLILAIPDADIELWKELLKVNCDQKLSNLLEISCTYYAIESGVAVMCAGKAIHALHQGHQPQKSKPQRSIPECPNCTCSHSPGHDNCPAWNATCNGCSKRDHWHAKCHSSGAVGKHDTKPNGTLKDPHHWHWEKGQRADIVQVSTEETPPCDELFANTVNCGSVGDTHPEEIVIDNICAPRCNEAYTMVKLPASISSKGTASLHVKVDTRAGGNVLPLHVFWHLHLDQISPAGLYHISTRLTAYNRSHIPLYGTFCGSIVWQPGSPGIRPHKINSYWYVADTPGPCHPRPSIMWEASNHEDELCHHSHETWHKTSQVLHLLPQQQQRSSLLQSPQQPSPSGQLMTW